MNTIGSVTRSWNKAMYTTRGTLRQRAEKGYCAVVRYEVLTGVDPRIVDRIFQKRLSPNPPKDTDGRREGSGRGWVSELQGRWPGLLG